MNKLYIIIALTVGFAGHMYLNKLPKPKYYETCMIENMKDQPQAMLSAAYQVCKRLPKLEK